MYFIRDYVEQTHLLNTKDIHPTVISFNEKREDEAG